MKPVYKEIIARIGNEQHSCYTHWGVYSNGRTALSLMSDEVGPIATVSINLHHVPEVFGDDEMAINHDTPDSILDELIEKGVIHSPHRTITVDYGTHTMKWKVVRVIAEEKSNA